MMTFGLHAVFKTCWPPCHAPLLADLIPQLSGSVLYIISSRQAATTLEGRRCP